MMFENEAEYFSKTFKGLEAAGQAFTQVTFEACTFENCNFSDARFHKCKFIDCTFSACNLSNLRVDYSKFADVSFNESKLVGVDWSKADWPRFNFISPLKFNECILNDSSFYGLEMAELVLEYCKAHDVDFRNGNFSKAQFCFTDFTSSLFMKTNLQEADFTEAKNYDIDIFNNNIKAARFTRLEALGLLTFLDIELVD
jgi:fluoroquinolone resistance protein